MKLELISFALCPFVQRSVITLKYKQADFKTTYIDLKNKPEWFLEISPLSLTPRIQKDPRWQTVPQVSNWSQNLLRLPAVQESVLPTFAEDHISYCKGLGSLLF